MGDWEILTLIQSSYLILMKLCDFSNLYGNFSFLSLTIDFFSYKW